MTGPEHYREAEWLLASTTLPSSRDHCADDGDRANIAAAQVHATLALTAATMDVAGATVNGVVSTGWLEALS